MENQKLDVYELIKDKLKIGVYNVPDLIESELTEIDTSDLTNHDHYRHYVNTIVNYIETDRTPMVKLNALGNEGYTYDQIFGYVITRDCSFGLVIRNQYNIRQVILISPSDLNYVIEKHKVFLEIPSYSFTWGREPVSTSLEFQVARINKEIDEEIIVYYKALNPVANNVQNFNVSTYELGSIHSEMYSSEIQELMDSGIFANWFRLNDDIVTMSLFSLHSEYDFMEVYSYDDHFDRLKKFIKRYYKIKYPENYKERSKKLIEYLKGIIKNSIPLKHSIKASECEIDISNIDKESIKSRILIFLKK